MALTTLGFTAAVAECITRRNAVSLNGLSRDDVFSRGFVRGLLYGLPLSEVTLATLVTLLTATPTLLEQAVTAQVALTSATAVDTAADTQAIADNTTRTATITAAQAALDALG